MVMSFAQEGMSPQRMVVNLQVFLPISPHRHTGLRWRNVVARTVLDAIPRPKPFGQILFRVRQSVSVAHQSIVADSEAVPLAYGTRAGDKLWIITESDRSVARSCYPTSIKPKPILRKGDESK